MITEKGGLTKITSPADIPRNREQIRNCRKNSTEKHDDLTILLFKCKEESKTNDPFLREVGAAPELHVFLCNSVQLNDIKRFCCNDINSSILGVDMTFNIGHYYVTVTIYRHKMLLTDRGVEPCMIGPVLVHQRKSFQSYYALPSLMIKHCPDLKDLQAIGTDGELALINAMKIVFSNSLHLQCDLHMKENIEHKMGECGMDSFLSSKVIFNIFGRQIGTSKLKGLVDCTTEEDFDSMLTTSVEEWKTLGVPDTFKTYFEEEKSHLIRNTMTANVRARAGLGNPPDMYRQQGNESLNNVIKRELHKKMSLVQFVDHLELLVHHQQQEVNLAIIGRGCYILKDEYKDEYGIKETVFYQKTEEQKKHCINKFNRGPVITKPALPRATIETNNSISRLTPSVTVAISSVTQHPIARRSPVVNTLVSSEIPEFGPADANGTLITGHSLHINDSSSQHEKSGSNTSSANKLSVTALQSQIQIPQEILSPMFKKASDLIANDNVNREPTLDEQFRVKSYSSPNTPHTLCMKGLKISCDSSCEGFTAYKLCAHSLAVAQFTGKLDNYIKSYNSHPKSSPNLYKLCSVGLSESRGKKATKSTNKRKFGPRKSSSAKKTILDIVSPSKSRDSQVSATVSSSFESSFSSLSPDKPQKYLTCIPPKNVLATIFKGFTIPDQPVVPLGTGRSLGVIPPQPEPQEQPYELTRRGNISNINGCGNNFDKCDTELFILGRTEFDWYPKIDRTNKTKFYKVSSAKNYYYCCLKKCVLMRRPMLTIPKIVYSGDTSVRAEMLKFIKEQFGIDDLFYNWMF